MDLYTKNSLQLSKLTTNNYSTSFSMGVGLLKKEFRLPIYAIYGFVRVADEIVDTFHDQDKRTQLAQFRENAFNAIENGMSTNPILHSFQWVVNEYKIDHQLIEAFLESMEMDLSKTEFTLDEFKKYVYGSAEVIGLMCLRVFYKNQDLEYEEKILPARKLGEAFQKINFLRDIHSDFEERGRFYFPGLEMENFNDNTKRSIEENIKADFDEAYIGLKKLNKASKLGVLVSYTYYLKLFEKIHRTDASTLFKKRFRISNLRKIWILISSVILVKLNLR
ncbi:MAG: phytoene/squalene synthase family protein [Bacteroidales bacterium]|jgi:phytoene synthase|nr:phytoene/squalene synthase family protein [Bacteroidales bacterium]